MKEIKEIYTNYKILNLLWIKWFSSIVMFSGGRRGQRIAALAQTPLDLQHVSALHSVARVDYPSSDHPSAQLLVPSTLTVTNPARGPALPPHFTSHGKSRRHHARRRRHRRSHEALSYLPSPSQHGVLARTRTGHRAHLHWPACADTCVRTTLHSFTHARRVAWPGYWTCAEGPRPLISGLGKSTEHRVDVEFQKG